MNFSFITGTGRIFFSLFAAVFIYAVGATVFIKSLTQDNKYAIQISNEAKADALSTSIRQTNFEIDVIKSVEGFKSSLIELSTEVRLLREEMRRGK